jgi:hypothetical protein
MTGNDSSHSVSPRRPSRRSASLASSMASLTSNDCIAARVRSA